MAYFGCAIRFDAMRDTLVLPVAVMDEPFTTANPDVVEIMTPGIEHALAGTQTTIVEEAKRTLADQLHGERPSLDKLARRMHLSARTLQRRLEEAGASYQTILDDVRKQISRRLLATTDLDTGEIAFLLGFEEHSSFTRAFHGWEGTTPTRFRASAT